MKRIDVIAAVAAVCLTSGVAYGLNTFLRDDGIFATVPGMSAGSGFIVDVFNPNIAPDPSNHFAIGITCDTDSTTTTSDFSDENCLELNLNGQGGQYSYGGLTNAKRTMIPLLITGNYNAAAQRFATVYKINCYGVGDCARESTRLTYAGGPIAGDEGQGLALVSLVSQQPSLNLNTVSAVTRSSCNTTTTQSVTGGPTPQAVSVASLTGCNVNDWIVLDQEVPSGFPNISAVQITAVGGGKITGIFPNNSSNGDTITPALVLTLDDVSLLGEGRPVVNLNGTSYSTGTVTSIGGTFGNEFVGTGTVWTNSIVGGSAKSIGCIYLDADTYSGDPFNGTGANGPLHSWFQITAVTNNTHLNVHSFSVAGDVSYRGKGPGGGTYKIQPCARILRVLPNSTQIVLETSSATWSVGNTVETSIQPFPDVAGFQYDTAAYTPGGTYRAWERIRNTGARKFEAGVQLDGNMPVGGGADTTAWGTGFSVDNADLGLAIGTAKTAAIFFGFGPACSGTDTCGLISWNNGQAITSNTPNQGMDLQMITAGLSAANLGMLRGSVLQTNFSALTWAGVMGTTATAFANVPTCNAGAEGLERAITNSTTATYGATVTGGGTNHIKAYCNGTNWIVD